MSKKILLSACVLVNLLGCQNDGFHAPQAGSKDLILFESPEVQDVAADAKESNLQMELERVTPQSAQVILSTEVEADIENADVNKAIVRSIISTFGMIVEFKAMISTAAEQDGKAVIAPNFIIDKVLKDSKDAAAAKFDSDRTFQMISHCSNSCDDLFIHIQVNKSGEFEAAAFYNFKREKSEVNSVSGRSYTLVSSSVGEAYKTLDQVRETLK